MKIENARDETYLTGECGIMQLIQSGSIGSMN